MKDNYESTKYKHRISKDQLVDVRFAATNSNASYLFLVVGARTLVGLSRGCLHYQLACDATSLVTIYAIWIQLSMIAGLAATHTHTNIIHLTNDQLFLA